MAPLRRTWNDFTWTVTDNHRRIYKTTRNPPPNSRRSSVQSANRAHGVGHVNQTKPFPYNPEPFKHRGVSHLGSGDDYRLHSPPVLASSRHIAMGSSHAQRNHMSQIAILLHTVHGFLRTIGQDFVRRVSIQPLPLPTNVPKTHVQSHTPNRNYHTFQFNNIHYTISCILA